MTTALPPGAGDPVDPAKAKPFPSAARYEKALAEIRAAAAAYYAGSDVLMDDDTYDALLARALATEAAHPAWKPADTPTEAVGAGVAPGTEIPHSTPMLGLDNVFDTESLHKWAARLERVLDHPVAAYTVEPKLDGLAVAARYSRGRLTLVLTRGTGTMGEDVTTRAILAKGLPAKLSSPRTIEVRGEVFMTDEDFRTANELRTGHGEPAFAHPRSAAAGTLRAVDRAYSAPLSFVAYAVQGLADDGTHSEAMAQLEKLGVATTSGCKPALKVCHSAEEIEAAVAEIRDLRGSLGFGVDGAVIKADRPEDRAAAGASTKAPRWGVAVKFPADTRSTKLLAIDVQVGRTGVITPVATLEPVFIDGVKVVSATLHNFDDLERRNVRVGDTVFVRRAGDVIPEITGAKLDERPKNAKPFTPPEVCPDCGSEIDRSQTRWRCTGGRACGARKILAHYATREAMDIEGLGGKIIDLLVAEGLVADPADLYDLDVPRLAALDGLGEISGGKLVAAIALTKKRPLSSLLTGLGIRMAGRAVSRRLARHFGSMDALLAATPEQLQEVEGVGLERAETIAAELAELAGVIAKLAARGLTMTEPDAAPAPAAATVLPLRKPDGSPMRVVVTGAVPGLKNRDEGNQAVERLGGTASGSVSAKTDLVVVGDGSGSKADKAAELGVRILPADRFADLLAAHDGGDDSRAAEILAS